MLRPADDVVGSLPFPLEQEIGLADRVGLGVDLLAVEVGGHLLAPLGRELLQHVLAHGQHAAGPAGAVIEQIGAGLDPVGYGQEDQLRHELHGVARGEVLAGLLVVLLVEAPDQLLEDRAHAVVVEPGMPDRAVGVDHRSRSFSIRLTSGEVSFSISEPRASALERRGIWLRNSKFSRMSWTPGEKPSR